MSGEEAGGRRAQGGELQRLATGGEALRIRSSVTLGRAQAGPATENDGVTLWLCLQELSVKAGVPRPPPTHPSQLLWFPGCRQWPLPPDGRG